MKSVQSMSKNNVQLAPSLNETQLVCLICSIILLLNQHTCNTIFIVNKPEDC